LPELLTVDLPSSPFPLLFDLLASGLFTVDLLADGLAAEGLLAEGLAAAGFAPAGLPPALFAWADNCWMGNNSEKKAITKSLFAVMGVLALFLILTTFKNYKTVCEIFFWMDGFQMET